MGTTKIDPQALAKLGIDFDAVRERLEQTFGPGALERSHSSCLGICPRLKLALAYVLDHASGGPLGDEHVLLGMLTVPDSVAAASSASSGSRSRRRRRCSTRRRERLNADRPHLRRVGRGRAGRAQPVQRATASGCGGSAHKTAPAQPFGPSTQLPDLEHRGRNINLFSLFNHDQGVARLPLIGDR